MIDSDAPLSTREPFVGRAAELGLLHAAAADVTIGRPRLVLLEGDAGSGKTALIRRALFERPPEPTSPRWVLHAGGDELEARLRHGILDQLLGAIGGESAQFGDTGLPLIAETVREVRQQLDEAGTDPLAAGAALLGMVDALQRTGDVYIVVDDAHWADVASMQALGFLLRRLRADRVLAVVALRPEGWNRLPAAIRRLHESAVGRQRAGGTRLVLDGLSTREIQTLSAALGSRPLSSRGARKLGELTGGNPLLTCELLRERSPDSFERRGVPQPPPRSFAALIIDRLYALDDPSQRLAGAAAVLGATSSLVSSSRVAGLVDPLDPLKAACDAGLLQHDLSPVEPMLTFPHALVRGAIYHGLDLRLRSELHLRAADEAVDPVDALRHRLSGTYTTHRDLALRARVAADQLIERGSFEAAAELLLHVFRLADKPAMRQQALLDACEAHLSDGNMADALALRSQVLALPDTEGRSYIVARLALIRGEIDQGEQLLHHAWDQIHERAGKADVALRRKVAEHLSLAGAFNGESASGVHWATEALNAADHAPAPHAGLRDTLAMSLVIDGRPEEALRVTAELPHAPGIDGLVGRGVARLWVGDLQGAIHDLSLGSRRERGGRPFVMWGLVGLASLAEAEYHVGAWDDALAHAELAVSIAEDAEQDWLLPFAHGVAAMPLAGQGRSSEAHKHLDAVGNGRIGTGGWSSLIWTTTSQALLAHADGDHQGVLAAVEPLRRSLTVEGPPSQGREVLAWALWHQLTVDALIRTGSLAEAEAILAAHARVTAKAPWRPTRWAARAWGNLLAARGRLREAADAFGRAQQMSPSGRFEQALLDDDHGRTQARVGDRAGAVKHLRAAAEAFRLLSARPYLERAERDLAALGAKSNDVAQRDDPGLTAHELAVAHLVQQGKSNREVAAELFVSIKTVEYHLSNAYAKLGVSSRTQLISRLQGGTPSV